jgi:hypothetical protein
MNIAIETGCGFVHGGAFYISAINIFGQPKPSL